MKETFDDIVRNENIPLPIIKPSNVDQLILDHHQTASGLYPLYDFHDSSTEEETDDGFEDELSESHQEKMRYKIEELNAQLAADPTPLESNRQRHVTFKENLVDIMDSNSPQPSPDLLGDEDINEKSLEEIQMLSQKPLFEELSAPSDDNNEHKRFKKDYSEQQHEPEDSSVNNCAESIETLEFEAPDLNETENNINEYKDSECEISNEDTRGERNKTTDEVDHYSEVLHSEKDNDANVNMLLNEETSCNTDMKILLNENNDNKNEDNTVDEVTSTETSHDTNIDKLQHDSSYIEVKNTDINELNLSSSSYHKDIKENIDYNSNVDELLVEKACAETSQNNISPKGLDEKETEKVEKILKLHDGLEQNKNDIDYDISGNCAPNFNNVDTSTDEVTPDKKSTIENYQTNVEDINYEGSKEKVLFTNQSLKLDEKSGEQINSSSDKPLMDTSVETKGAKPSVASKSKSFSKLKSIKSAENQANKKLPNYKGNPRSQYGLSKEECKDLMHIQKEKISQMKMREKEEEESRIQKQEEARKAFSAWLSKKKIQEKHKNKKVTKVVSIKEVPTKEMSINRNRKNMLDFARPLRIEELKHGKDITQSLLLAENRNEYGDAEEAFQAWLKKKEQQISREEILKQLEEEEKALNQCRVSRREAAKAFNKWLVGKQKDQNQLNRRVTPRGNYLNTLPLQARHIEAFAQTFHAYLGNTM